MLNLIKDENGKILPIKSNSVRKVATPDELSFFFKYCFSPNEKKIKSILLFQLGAACRVREACAVNLNDFVKGSNFREVDVLIQKKSKLIDGKLTGSNVIERKILPEAIACYVRSWIKDNYSWILENKGFIFPRSHQQKSRFFYTSPCVVERWFCKKRKQLSRLFPDKCFDYQIGKKVYNSDKPLKPSRVEPLYLWSSHMFKRFAGTYAYLLTKDVKFVQRLLSHEDLEVTQKHYIDNATIFSDFERVNNTLFDVNFYNNIKSENEDIPAVWLEARKKLR